MQTLPRPDAEEVRDNATFAALMWALARPGRVRDLPEPGMAGIARALCDRECRVHADDPGLAAVLAATDAAAVPAEKADHVFAETPPDLTRLAAGSALDPDDGATVVLPAGLGRGTALRLTGPGIEDEAVVHVDGPEPAFWAGRAAACRYPAGVELFLVDGARVMGLPRSTQIEVL